MEKTIDDVAESNNIVIFDSLETIQGYEGAGVRRHKDHYMQKTAKSFGITVDELIRDIPAEQYLKRAAELTEKGELKAKMLPGAQELMQKYINRGIRPVIMTSDLPEGAEQTSKPIVEAGLVMPRNVYGIAKLGSKKEADTWTEAKQRYEPDSVIAAVYEDTIRNLFAAVTAYHTQGYLVKETESGIAVMIRN